MKEHEHPKETINHHLQRLRTLRNRIKYSTRDIYAAMDGDTRQRVITYTMKSVVPSPAFVDELIYKQMGSDHWTLTDEESAYLPPSALKRFQQVYENRSMALWPWLLFADRYRELRIEYMKSYNAAASFAGTFPYAPTETGIPHQRDIDWRHRVLAAQVMFAQSCITTTNIQPAAAPFLSMIGNALNAYGSHSIPELQAAVQQKAPNISRERMKEFDQFDMWNNKGDLSLMCVDRGLRDLIVDYYGIFRGVILPQTSGYIVGQTVMATKARLRSIADECLRVSN